MPSAAEALVRAHGVGRRGDRVPTAIEPAGHQLARSSRRHTPPLNVFGDASAASRRLSCSKQLLGISDEELWAAQEPTLRDAIASGDFPAVTRPVRRRAFAMAGEEALRFGLGPLLDGLATLIAAKRGGAG